MNDDTPMPWGPHKGTPLGQLPPDHALWLLDQPWLQGSYPELHAYLAPKRMDYFGAIPEDDSPKREAQSYEDYMKNWRGL